MSKIVVSSDTSGIMADWMLDKVVIEDLADKKTYEFPCNRWLSKDKGDQKTERELHLNTGSIDPPTGTN